MEFLNYLPLFFLVLVRMTSFFITAPIFSTRGVPNAFKIGLGFFLSLVSVSAIDMTAESTGVLAIDGTYLLLIIKEVFIGASLGFIASLLMYAAQVAGAFIDMQMGFAIANVVDPQTGAQSPITGNFKYILAILFLLSLNGHHMMIRGVISSYYAIPLQGEWQGVSMGAIAEYVVDTFLLMFTSAFMIAAPIIACLFLVDVSLGIVARTVPQMNVFVVGLPLKIFVSFAIMLFVLPGYFFLLEQLFQQMYQSMAELMKLLGGT